MAMVTCKECKQDVSAKAKVCPNCGVKQPGITGKRKVFGCLGLLCLGFLIITIAGFVAEQQDKQAASDTESVEYSVLSVSDFSFTIKGQPAVSVAFGVGDGQYCSMTIPRSSVKAGYVGKSEQDAGAVISGTCFWNGKTYLESSKHPTVASLAINSLDEATREAEIAVSLHLVEPTINEYLTVDNWQFVIDGEQFANLVKKM